MVCGYGPTDLILIFMKYKVCVGNFIDGLSWVVSTEWPRSQVSLHVALCKDVRLGSVSFFSVGYVFRSEKGA